MADALPRCQPPGQSSAADCYYLTYLAEWWQRRGLSDATVVCRERTWHVHRLALASQSKYFASVFTNGMQASQSQELDLSDNHREEIGAMLQFMYQRRVEPVDKPAMIFPAKMYCLADYYDVPSLTVYCLDWLHREGDALLLSDGDGNQTEALTAFVRAAAEVYSRTTDANHGVRPRIAQRAAKHRGALWQLDEFKRLLVDQPVLAKDMIEVVRELG